MNDFQGTLTVSADGGTMAALVTQIGAGAGSVVLPAAPLR